METLLIRYNPKNVKALNAMRKVIKSIDYDNVTVESSYYPGLEEALKDVEEGRIITYNNFEDFKMAMDKLNENVQNRNNKKV